MLIVGLFMQWTGLLLTAVVVYSAVVLFQLINLPVEFNASGRARQVLVSAGIVVVLISSISSFIMAGPRVLVAMAKAGALPQVLGRTTVNGSPTLAVLILGGLSLLFLWNATFIELLALVQPHEGGSASAQFIARPHSDETVCCGIRTPCRPYPGESASEP